MRHWLIWSALLVMVIAAIAGWRYIEHVNDVEQKKVELWQRLTDRESSTLAECLKHDPVISRCMEKEAAVDKAVGR